MVSAHPHTAADGMGQGRRGIRYRGVSAAPGMRARRRRGTRCRAPAFSRGVAVEPMAWRTRSLRTAAARAIRRMAAARSCPGGLTGAEEGEDGQYAPVHIVGLREG